MSRLTAKVITEADYQKNLWSYIVILRERFRREVVIGGKKVTEKQLSTDIREML